VGYLTQNLAASIVSFPALHVPLNTHRFNYAGLEQFHLLGSKSGEKAQQQMEMIQRAFAGTNVEVCAFFFFFLRFIYETSGRIREGKGGGSRSRRRGAKAKGNQVAGLGK
jgi:hypothetical protein